MTVLVNGVGSLPQLSHTVGPRCNEGFRTLHRSHHDEAEEEDVGYMASAPHLLVKMPEQLHSRNHIIEELAGRRSNRVRPAQIEGGRVVETIGRP